MNEYLLARNSLTQYEVSVVRETPSILWLVNKHGMKHCIRNDADSIYDYIFAD